MRMKPATIERRTRERAAETKVRRNELRQRLRRLAERDGPDSIWPELLQELEP